MTTDAIDFIILPIARALDLPRRGGEEEAAIFESRMEIRRRNQNGQF